MENNQENIKVGIGVMIFKDDKILLGKRKGSHGSGEYAPPGGHLEYLESFEDCARRETLEEAGIKIKNLKFLCVENSIKYKPKQYINVEFTADWESGIPTVCEPDKREDWDWYDLDNLPSPLFNFCVSAFDAYKTGKKYYDKE